MIGRRGPHRVNQRLSGRWRFWIVLLAALIAAAGMRVFDITPAVAQSSVVTVWRSDVDPGLDPHSSVWDDVPATLIQLTAQNVTPPSSDRRTPWVSAAAVHYDDVLYVNLHWVDATADQATDAVGVFADAVAIQFPAVAATSVPAVCMGQADSAVNIWHWRADSQEGINAIPEDVFVDMYPEVDELHYPAAAASNIMVSESAVQNLVAGGFGTLTPVESQVIAGVGSHSESAWSVTMARPFAPPGELQPTFETGSTTDVAFAVWNGANGDRNGQKSVSEFVRMTIVENVYEPAGVGTTNPPGGGAAAVGWIVLLSVIVMIAVIGVSRGSNDDEREVPQG